MWSKVYVGLHVKYRLFLPDFSDSRIFFVDFEKHNALNLHENPFRGSRDVSCEHTIGWTDRHNVTNIRFSE